MKRYISLLALIISYTTFAQHADTAFVKGELTEGSNPGSPAIFIDTSGRAKRELTNFVFNHYDSATYFEQLKRLRPLKHKKTVPENFPRKWIVLYQLKGKNYLYRPCDWGYHFRFEITDSTTINYTMEGPEPGRLDKISFPSKTHAIIEATNYWEGRRVEIKLVDTAKGIAVVTFGPTKYREGVNRVLMVDAKKVHLFPIIVNYCPTSKVQEIIDFDKIDFKSLLKEQ
ncbi:MAG TPA: hypothetical protein DHW64_06655 [Chitinophagaceae bacterium]|nr:hypothetical protein [Chitinophagaceae bacterium]